ncbi:MAG: DUF1385 domain-containing protein [Clostridia bacterium]|nr:DUF1385 domain-containing protein [Clostridia bacterium]
MKKEKTCYTAIGGSALIEGVMMRSPEKTAIAVRRERGDIVLKVSKNKQPNKIIAKIPIIRGLVNFVASMKLSYSSMMYAADVAMEEIEEETPPETKMEKFLSKVFGKTGLAVLGVLAMVIGAVMGIGLFLGLPTLIVSFVTGMVPAYAQLSDGWQQLITSLGEGVIKMVVFLCYLLLISQMKDIKRVFQYHGAEHKSIFCHEKGQELTPENAAKFKRFHPRCGTSFLFLTLLVSIVISTLITTGNVWLRAGLRICLLPVMMGLAYECIRLAGKYDNVLTRILSAPGMWFQRLTTKEPDKSQLEIAIAALNGVLKEYPLDQDLILTEESYKLKEKNDESTTQTDSQEC